MKSTFKSAILLFTGAAMLASSASAAVNITKDDVYLAFYRYTGTTTATLDTDTYVFDLGSAMSYRDNTQTNVSITAVNTTAGFSANIGTDLITAFGANWANEGTVRWAFLGGRSVGTTPTNETASNGDPTRTIYYSQSRTDLAVDTTPITLSSGDLGLISTQIPGFRNSTNTAVQTAGVNPNGAIININQVNTIDNFLPPEKNTFFNSGYDPRQTFTAGLIGNSTFEGALDMYRYLNSTSGADLTVGMTPGNAQQYVGSFMGTLTIDGLGNLAISEISAVPEPSGALALGVIGAVAGLGYRSRRQKANA